MDYVNLVHQYQQLVILYENSEKVMYVKLKLSSWRSIRA